MINEDICKNDQNMIQVFITLCQHPICLNAQNTAHFPW